MRRYLKLTPDHFAAAAWVKDVPALTGGRDDEQPASVLTVERRLPNNGRCRVTVPDLDKQTRLGGHEPDFDERKVEQFAPTRLRLHDTGRLHGVRHQLGDD